MIPIKHPSCNDVLKAPPGDDNCDDLHIAREEGAVWSFWKPEPEELAAIVAGGTVALRVSGSTHPPLCILATAPTEQIAVAEHAHVFSAAIDRRYQSLLSITKRAIAAWTRETTNRSHDHNRLTDEFLDLLTLNHGKGGDIVREAPVQQPETVQATTTENDAARYRADAEGWKAEAERWRKVAEEATATDGQRTFDAGGWMNECLEAEAEISRRLDPAESWKSEAESLLRQVRLINESLGDEFAVMAPANAITVLKNRIMLAEQWRDEWKQQHDAKQAAIDSVIDQLNRVSVINPNPAES